jgi:dihydroflavonol-4-reductase
LKVFITGGTGFIGGHTVSALRAAGHQLRALVRDPANVPPGLRRPEVELARGDVTDETSLRRAAEGCDGVVHLAGVNSHWEADRSVYRAINLEGTRKVMQAALASGASVVVNVGTALVYGKAHERPFTEGSEPGPRLFTSYARSKAAADRVARRMMREHGLPLVTIMPGGVMGPGNVKQTSQYTHAFVNKKLPGVIFPNVVHTYVHVGDVATMIARALVTPAAIGRDYLAGDEPLSTVQMNEMLTRLTGVTIPQRRIPGFAMHLLSQALTAVADVTNRPPPPGLSRGTILTLAAGSHFDGSRARRELGIEYTPIEESLAQELGISAAGPSAAG